MVDGDLFDKLAEIGSKIKKDPRPFGGIQVCFFVQHYCSPMTDGEIVLGDSNRRLLSAPASSEISCGQVCV